MLEEKAKQTIRTEVIALPPLRMVLVHAKDEHLNKAALQSAIRKILVIPETQEEQINVQSLKKLIKHLEKKP
jgi:hypothetical protein